MHTGTTDPHLNEFTRVLLELRWGDMDAYGHVNNVTQLRLLEEARVRALGSPTHSSDAPTTPGRLGIAETVSGIAIPAIFAEASATTELLVASHTIEYRRPIPYREGPLAIDLVISEVKPASVTIGYVIAEPDGSVGYTLAETVIVFVDRASSRPRRLSQEETAAMEDVIRPAVPMRGRRR
ncbi:MAG: acyl-CoA thioesterase [Brevibacterium sp.]|uniref:acyl-CoA thioesterase n=1 Tax=Brevibacterium sp. TaxID=1701 RepID=UPI0026474F5F|nr:acyl-CoA thioesterase [Brevibacterium sp.]MDN5805716.1 acyl-CoA thioesterase [Brevibacterium sp.]MDN5832819.1 acyl-CoA thioesterase [Brevibacterium sp.]MDN5908064.1 acyl-CoA thioesterase [Brevibacterium sp.]MDN6133656.1 acyl-CoA thioesterase [Brevibacterium sp.]MDN6158148.1 acyl-CoA thioesterase [Brevibacterium sp.]